MDNGAGRSQVKFRGLFRGLSFRVEPAVNIGFPKENFSREFDIAEPAALHKLIER